MSRFRPSRGRLWGVFNTPLRPGTCDASKYRCNAPIGYVRFFEIPMRSPDWVRAALQKTVPFLSPSGSWGGRMRYAPTTGYVRFFKIPMQFFNWVRARVQKMDLYTTPTVAYGGAYAIRPYDRIRAILRNTDAILQLGTCEGSKNGSVYATVGGVWWGVCDTPLQPSTCGPPKNYPVFVSFGAICGAYAIRPYDRIRVILQNIDVIPRPGTCGPPKNYPVFVSFGAICGAYAIRPYDRIRVILQNIDVIPRPGTCGPSKNCLVFVPYGAVGWGVFDTPLQLDTCDPSKYRCNSPTGYVRGFKKWICIRHRWWRMVGRMRYAPTTGYVWPFKKLSRFRPLRDRLWGVCDTPLRPGTYDPSKYRCNFQTGYVRPFKELSRFRLLRGRGVVVFDTPLQSGTCEGSKNGSVFATVGGVCGAYAIRPYGWLRAILRNTDAISRAEGRGRLGGGAVGATACGGDGRE